MRSEFKINNNESKSLSSSVYSVAVIVLLLGAIFVAAAAFIFFLPEKNEIEFSALLNVGCSLIATSIASILINKFTKDASLVLQDRIIEQIDSKLSEEISQIQNMVNYTNKRITQLDTINREIVFLDKFSKRIQYDVFSAGILSASSVWAGEVDDDVFFCSTSLDIKLKDGRSFFPKKKAALVTRFSSSSLKTRVLMLHPEFQYIDAVADMDLQKAGNKNLQIYDCLAGIEIMQKIREEILRTGVDISEKVEFIGYRMIPTWAGYISEDAALIHYYFSRPYRGKLNTLHILKRSFNQEVSDWYKTYCEEYDELHRISVSNYSDTNLWDYKTIKTSKS